MRVFLSYVQKQDWLEHGISLPPMQPPKPDMRPMTAAQIRQLMDAMSRRPFIGPRDRTIALTFFDTGLRLSEVTSLNVRDVDLRGRTISVLGKGGRPRSVVFGKAAKDALGRCLHARMFAV